MGDVGVLSGAASAYFGVPAAVATVSDKTSAGRGPTFQRPSRVAPIMHVTHMDPVSLLRLTCR